MPDWAKAIVIVVVGIPVFIASVIYDSEDKHRWIGIPFRIVGSISLLTAVIAPAYYL